jgi:hypothetical protein
LVVRPRDGADALAIVLHLGESGALAALVFDDKARPGDGAPADPATLAGSLERLATLVTQTQTAVIFLTEPSGYTRALALTDHDGLIGAVEFWRAAREQGIRPLIGAEVTLAHGSHLTLLAETQAGYANSWASSAS